MLQSLQKIEQHFKIESIGFYFDRVFSKNYDFKGESHNFIELVYIESGSAEIVENDKVYLLSSNDLILHKPMEFHRIKSGGQTSPHVYNLSFSVSGALPEQLFEGIFHLNFNDRERIAECFNLAKLFLNSNSNLYDGQQTSDALSTLLIDIYKNSQFKNSVLTDNGALTYKQLIKDMQNAVCDNITITDLAKNNFISVSYVKKLFYQYANESPKKYYDTLRLKEAKRLLGNDILAAQIAEAMHFSSPNHFTVFFKKLTGLTPTEYKKQLFHKN